ncbi:hypothetical protein [Thorsellia anophelis]|uniref:Uncharacterized protein n=1 Tax=Thorsellia anophelis DSM 18579 TaxID=1123402 RepID=A0A1I0APD8_9GAMM|nr:hypothetical protein [Thorsellia anophelis]SES96192.1 hypothetical protein SAMN02583745_01006 [Thorsellia anophelis DSM 18579]
MFNFIKNLFDQIFPLKDDPRRAMELVYQHTIRFGKAITPIIAVEQQDEIGIAYQLNNGLQNYYSDEVNQTLIELGLDPSLVTENQLKQYGSELFKAAVRSMLSDCGLFYEVTSSSGRSIVEAFDSHLMNHDLDFSTLFPNHTESSMAAMSAAKALSLYIDALKQYGILPIAISLKTGYLLSTIKIDKSPELESIKQQFGIELGIEPFLHPLYYESLNVQTDDDESIQNNAPQDESDSEIDNHPTLANTPHFFDDLPSSKLAALSFMQQIRKAHDDLYPLLALSTSEINEFHLAYLEVRTDIFTEIENDVWNYLLHTYQSINDTRLESLTDEMINAYLNENTLFMQLSNFMISIPYSIQIDLMDAFTLIEEVIGRLEQQNIAIPAKILALLEEAEESTHYESLMTQLQAILQSLRMSLVMFETGEDHSFYFLVKQTNLDQILELSRVGLLSVHQFKGSL